MRRYNYLKIKLELLDIIKAKQLIAAQSHSTSKAGEVSGGVD